MQKHGSRHLPAVQCVGKKPILYLERELIDILRIEIVADVVVARTVVARQISRKGREDASCGELQESAVRDGVHAAAPGVVDLSHQAVPQAFHSGQLQPVVVTVSAGGKLRNGPESWIGGLYVRKRRKTPIADRLIAVHLRQIRLVYRASAHVLRVDTSGGTELMSQAKTPLHKVRRMEFAIRYRRDGDWRKASRSVRLCRRAGKLALRKTQAKDLIGGHDCVNRTARDSRSDCRAADSPEKSALERFDVGGIETNRVGDATGQNVTENAESGAQHRLGLKLPRDRGPRLQDRKGRRGKHVAETGLNGRAQRLIH